MAFKFNPFTGKLDIVNNGDVVGPSSATDNAIVRYDGTTGKLIQDSSNTIDDNGTLTSTGSVATDIATYSAELLPASGVTWTSTGWTGDNTSGWVADIPNTDSLYNSLTPVVGEVYRIQITYLVQVSGAVNISFGGTTAYYINGTYEIYLRATTTDSLVVAPEPAFGDLNGTITLSITRLDVSSPIYVAKDSGGTSRMEIRSNSLSNNKNTFIGYRAGARNLTGTGNTYVGYESGSTERSGADNTVMGYGAGAGLDSGSRNTVFGSGALNKASTINNAVVFGYQAGYNLTTGANNTFIGSSAGYTLTTGNGNTAFGTESMYTNGGGSFNLIVGYQAYYTSTGGSFNLALGSYAMNGTTGAPSDNVAIGYSALSGAATYYDNVAVGSNSQVLNRGHENTSIGSWSLRNKTTGDDNVAIGAYTIYGASGAFSYQTIVGAYGGYSSTGTGNTGLGYNVLRANTTGTYNTSVGYQSGTTYSTNSYCTFVGQLAKSTANGLTNSMALGSTATVDKSNQVVIGNTSIAETLLRGNVGFHQTSPQATAHIPYRTWSITGDTTNLDPIVVNVSDTTGLFVGQLISGTGITAGTTIASIDSSTQITMSAAATATNTGVAITGWVAQMIVGSGTLLTTNKAGAIENSGTHIYWTSDAGTRYQLDQQASGVADADYGDITVSGGVWTIDAGVVTEAKQVLADNTTNDVSTSKHGYVPKGTNTGLTFLRDDGTWASPYTLVATLASDASTGADTNFIDLTGLVFSYVANATYRIWFMGTVSPNAATTGNAFALNLSSAVTSVYLQSEHMNNTTTGAIVASASVADDVSINSTTAMPGTAEYPVVGHGLLITTSNTGTAQLRFRSELAAVTTAKAGMTMVVERVA